MDFKLIFFYVFDKFFFFFSMYLMRETDTERTSPGDSTDSLSRCLQQPVLGRAKAKSQELGADGRDLIS